MLSRIGAALGKMVSPIASTLASTSDQSNSHVRSSAKGDSQQGFKRQKKEDLPVVEVDPRLESERQASQQEHREKQKKELKKFEEQVDEIEASMALNEPLPPPPPPSKNGDGVTGTFLKLLSILQEKSPIGKNLATRSYQAIAKRQSTSTKIQKGVMLNEEVK